MRFVLAFVLLALLGACSSRDAGLTDLGTDAGLPDLGPTPDLGNDAAVLVDMGTPETDAGIDGGPDCTGMMLCTTPGASCDGNTRVLCGRNPAGCLVEVRSDCTTVASGTCSTVGGAHCTVDRCASRPSLCSPAGRSCTGDTLVTCAADGEGCLVSTNLDCTSIGGTCLPMPTLDGGAIGPAACSAPSPCYLVDPTTFCSVEGRTCATSTRLADCHMNATGCLVVTNTTCMGSPLAHCDDTLATPACVDPCAGLTLCAATDPAAQCIGARIVTCTRDAAGCYVRAETNCGTTGMGCDASSGTPICSGALCPAMAGTLSCTGRSLPYSQAGDTATESNVLPRSTCTTPHIGHEGIWTFTSDVAAVAHVHAHAISDTTGTYNIFVLDGTAAPCDTSSVCVDRETVSGTLHTVDFAVLPGERYYVVYDGVDAVATTTYSMLVECDLCGDGAITSPEVCDDGNLTAGDGCSASCQPEVGWACDASAPSVCHRTICGNGILEPGETCDDNNTAAGDGCSPLCQAETFTTLAARGGSVTVMGTLAATDPVFDHPSSTCGTGFDPGCSYDVWVVENTGTSAVTITVHATWASGGDGYLTAYRPPFDPTMPTLDCLTANDDFGGIMYSQISGITVAPGAQAIIIATELYASGAPGPYTLLITSM